MKSVVVLATFLLLPRAVSAHHFMGDQLPQTLTQDFLSGPGHPVIGVHHAAFIFAAGFPGRLGVI